MPSNATAVYPDLVTIYETSLARHADRPLFGTKRDGRWEWLTYAEFGDLAGRFRSGLLHLGLRRGDRLAIVAGNRAEWAVAAYAALGLGCAVVPMYEAQNENDWRFILKDSGAKILVTSTPDIERRTRRFAAELPDLKASICLAKEPGFRTFDDVLAWSEDGPEPARAPAPGDLAFIIYTSGTTGQPKGVMLSHHNIASNVSAVRELFPLDETDRCLSFLPWAHAFGQTAELHLFVSLGASIAVCSGLDRLVSELSEVKPTVLCAVPRIFNKIYAGVRQQMAAKPKAIRSLFGSGLEAAARRRNHGRLGAGERAALFLADRLIFSKIRRKFGGRLRFAISGGAALEKTVAEFIDSLGIPVYEGYGLSETSPIICCNCPGRRRIGSVGKPIPGVRVAIDPVSGLPDGEGEIVVRGPNVMRGYHNAPDDSARVFAGDGALRTGDLGYLDSEDFLFITGRIKEQYKLSNGKYIAPAPLEEKLKLSPFIANVMICGDNRPYNVALVVPDRDAVRKWAAETGVQVPEAELAGSPPVRDLIGREIDACAGDFRKCERIRRFGLIDQDFTQENGLLTPTLKLRRREAASRLRREIDGLYEPGPGSADPARAGRPPAGSDPGKSDE